MNTTAARTLTLTGSVIKLLCVFPGWGTLIAQEVRPPVDLVIVAGQSNAVGFDASPNDLPADDRDADILFWWRCGDPPADQHDSVGGDAWTSLQPQPLGQPITPRRDRQYGNFGQPEGGFGPEMSLARELVAATPTRRLAVLKVAFSGTGLRTDWNPDDPGEGGACYRALCSEYRRAMQAASDAGWQPQLRAFVWIQGESDANAQDAPQYADRLQRLLTRLREDCDRADLPAFVAVNTRFGEGRNRWMPQIVRQQQSLAAREPLVTYVDTSAATIANGAHYDAAGTLLTGRLFAATILQAEAKARAASARPSEQSTGGDGR